MRLFKSIVLSTHLVALECEVRVHARTTGKVGAAPVSQPIIVVGRGKADRAIKNSEGKTAEEVAELNEQQELVALLRE